MEHPDGEVVASLMPQLRSEVERLVRIPSIAFPGFPPEPLFDAHDFQAAADDSWRPKGVTGFGARLLTDPALRFPPPGS
jgi:hypothetical protein